MATVLLGVTGCIAAYKACEILRALQGLGLDVRVVMTEHATRFVGPVTFEALSRHPVYLDPFARDGGAEMPHVQWTTDADLLLVAPATANILGKFAHGIADDALSTLYLATQAPVVIAPAMNVAMWRHPAVVANLALLRARGVSVVEPGTGYLACGAVGEGRLGEVQQIVAAVAARLQGARDLAGVSVLVTAGPTREPIDPVRFISNRSSGRMGYALAAAARDRGARVTLVSGPTALSAPSGVERVDVVTAEEMARAVETRAPEAQVIVMAAAVCDERPAQVAAQKIKKGRTPRPLELVENLDILRSLGAKKGERVLVGFAAETEDMRAQARRKLTEKHLDLIVANDVSRPGAGFESESNAALLIGADGQEVELPLSSKRELAERIWDRVVGLLAQRAGQSR
jgi:phosphopantothenoylcysteine decarboxylase / phosphopantothenate---cysteine ligase